MACYHVLRDGIFVLIDIELNLQYNMDQNYNKYQLTH